MIFFILAENIDCGYSLEPPRRGGSNEYPQSILGIVNGNTFHVFVMVWVFWMRLN